MVSSLSFYDLPFPSKWGFHMPHYTRMAISLQRVIRSTSCLVLGQGFPGRRIEWRYLRNRSSDPCHVLLQAGVFGDGGCNGAISSSNKSKMAAEFQMAISPQPVVRSTSLFGYRAGFLGTADLIALFSIRINSSLRPPPSWIISNGRVFAMAHDLLIQRASRGHLCDSTAFLFTYN